MKGKEAHKKAIAYADAVEPRAKGYGTPPKCYRPEAASICKRWNDAYSKEFKRLRSPEETP